MGLPAGFFIQFLARGRLELSYLEGTCACARPPGFYKLSYGKLLDRDFPTICMLSVNALVATRFPLALPISLPCPHQTSRRSHGQGLVLVGSTC